MADPLAKDLIPAPGKPSPTKAQRLITKESILEKTYSSKVSANPMCCSHRPFVLSSWFDRLTTIGFFPNVLSKVEGQAQGERFFAFCEGREALGLQCLFNDGPIHKLTCQAPPLKRERCTSKMELSLTISMTVIIRVKRSSKYSDICMVHREKGTGRPPGPTAWPGNGGMTLKP